MRRESIFIIISGLLFLLLYSLHLFNLKNHPEISSILPPSFRLQEIKYTRNHRPYYIITSSQKGPGIAVLSEEFLPEVSGYNGPINMLIILDNALRIKYLKVIHHTENIPQANKISSPAFLKQFIGKSYKDPFQIGKDIDAITGATVSSSAVTQILKRTLLILQGIRPPQNKIKKKILLSTILLILAALSLLLFYTPKPVFRYLLLLYTILFTGFIFRFFITTPRLYNILTFQIPPLTPVIPVFLFTLLFILLLGKNTFCNAMCPFGAVQQIIHKINPLHPPVRYPSITNTIKLLIFFSLFYTVFLTGNPGILNLDPFSTLFCIQGNTIAWMQLSLILIGSLLYYRIWCRTVCPVGTFFELIGKIKIPRIKVMPENKKIQFLFVLLYTGLLVLTGAYLYSNIRQSSSLTQEISQKAEPGPAKKVIIKKEQYEVQEKLKQKLEKYKKYGITPRKAMYYE